MWHPHAPMTSIYPPPMLAMHAWVMHITGDVYGFRGLAIGGGIVLLMTALSLLAAQRNKPTLVVAIAWNPVLVLFATGEGHHDIVAAAVLALAFYALHHKLARTSIVLGALAALLKPFALAALPVLLAATTWRHSWIPPLVALLSYLPFLDAGHGLIASLLTFGADMQYHGALEPLLRGMTQSPTIVRLMLAAMFITGLVWLHRRSNGEQHASRAARSLALLLFTTNVMNVGIDKSENKIQSNNGFEIFVCGDTHAQLPKYSTTYISMVSQILLTF